MYVQLRKFSGALVLDRFCKLNFANLLRKVWASLWAPIPHAYVRAKSKLPVILNYILLHVSFSFKM